MDSAIHDFLEKMLWIEESFILVIGFFTLNLLGMWNGAYLVHIYDCIADDIYNIVHQEIRDFGICDLPGS